MNRVQKSTQATKRRGPLLWLSDLARRRPALAAVLAVLLTLLASVSVGTTVLVRRQQRLAVAEQRAMEAWRQQRQQRLSAQPPAEAP